MQALTEDSYFFFFLSICAGIGRGLIFHEVSSPVKSSLEAGVWCSVSLLYWYYSAHTDSKDGAAVNSLESAAVHASKKRTADVHQKAEKDEQGGKSAAHRSQKSSKTRAGAGLPSSAAAAGPHTAVYLASAYCYTQILLYTAVYKAA